MIAPGDSPAAAIQETAGSGRIYRRLWRWHFYAAFLVIPFVLMQAITGTMYLWHEEWADWAYPGLRFVTPSSQTASYDAQLAAAVASQPDARPTTLVIPDDPSRATQVMFGARHGVAERGGGRAPNRPASAPAELRSDTVTRAGSHHGEGSLPFPVFVDPYSGRVLGAVTPWRWMPGWTRKVHGGWPLGDAGSWLLELGACWAVVMILTGLYLWWPREGGVLRALLPRWNLGAQMLVRDLHACVAVWFSVVILVFLVTALPWTKFWGDQVLKPIQHALNQDSPFAATSGVQSTPLPEVAPMSLDEAVHIARASGLQGALELALVDGAGDAQNLRNRRARASDEMGIALDRYSRELLFEITWADYAAIPRWVSTGVDLHEGTYFGRANQWLNTLVSVALVWMSASGLLSWWLRRPRGTLGVPAARAIVLPRGLLVGAGLLCVVLPMLGASVLLLVLVERVCSRVWARAEI